MRNTETKRIRTTTKFVRSCAGHSESALRLSVMKTVKLIVLQPSRTALTIPGETLSLSIAAEICTVVSCNISLHVTVHLPSLHDVRFELEDCLRRRNSPVFFLKRHGSEMESVQFVFPNGFDFGVVTNTRRSDGAPEPDGTIKAVARKKILHYRQLCIDHPDPIDFMSVAVDTSDRIYDDFLSLLFLHAHREASVLANDIPEESGHFRFVRATCLDNIKGSVGLILAKASTMRISIPLDLSSKASYRSMGTTGDPVPVGQRDVPVNHFTG